MKTAYHLEITRKALAPHFSEAALQTILKANIRQDRIKYQFGHDHFHFDGSAFQAGFAFIAEQETLVIQNITGEQYPAAREALGRITHTWQDYYSHSNYVRLWLSANSDSPPEMIDPADPHILNHLSLISGRNYGLIEFIAMLPALSSLITPLMPDDSHAKMNLDSPAAGPLFPYNYHAAFKRTILIYDHLLSLADENHIAQDQITQFQGK